MPTAVRTASGREGIISARQAQGRCGHPSVLTAGKVTHFLKNSHFLPIKYMFRVVKPVAPRNKFKAFYTILFAE